MKFTIYDLRFTRDLPLKRRMALSGFVGAVLSLSLAACDSQKPVSPKQIVGTWGMEDTGELTFNADHSFRSTWRSTQNKVTESWNYEGVWDISDTLLTMVVTNANAINGTNFESVGSIEPFIIIKADKSSLILKSDRQDDITNCYSRK